MDGLTPAYILLRLVAHYLIAADYAVGTCAVCVTWILRGDFISRCVEAALESASSFTWNSCWEYDGCHSGCVRNHSSGGWRLGFHCYFSTVNRFHSRGRCNLVGHARGLRLQGCFVGRTFVSLWTTVSRFRWHGDAAFRRRLAILNGANHLVPHTVAVSASLVSWHCHTIFVELSLVHASCLWRLSRQNAGRYSSGGFSAAVVSGRAAAGLREHREAAVHVQLTVLEYAGAAVPDAVAHFTGLLGISGHTCTFRVMPPVHVTPCAVSWRSFGFGFIEGGRHRHRRAGDVGAALPGPLGYGAIVSELLHVRTYPQETHEHAALARAVQARLVRLDLLAVLVVLQHEIASSISRRSHLG